MATSRQNHATAGEGGAIELDLVKSFLLLVEVVLFLLKSLLLLKNVNYYTTDNSQSKLETLQLKRRGTKMDHHAAEGTLSLMTVEEQATWGFFFGS